MRLSALYLILATAVAALSTTTEPFATQVEQTPFGVFLPREFDYGAFAASVVNVCSQTTTWALQCTGPATAVSKENARITDSPDSSSCGLNAPFLTITEAESVLAFSAQAPRGTETVLLHESCSISGDWRATCVEEYTAGSSSIHSATTTLTGKEFNVAQVTITAGASKLTTTDACQQAATPTPLPNSAGTGTLDGCCKRLVIPLAMGLLQYIVQ